MPAPGIWQEGDGPGKRTAEASSSGVQHLFLDQVAQALIFAKARMLSLGVKAGTFC